MAARLGKLSARLTGLANRAPGLARGGVEFAKPKLNTFWKYAKVELRPPGPSEVPQIAQGMTQILQSARTGAWKKLTVHEMWLNALVAVEIGCWFYVGEIIGKGHVIGYQVPGTTFYDIEY